jgi:hypothetical protein
MMQQRIAIPPIVLDWSDWIPWNRLKIHANKQQGISVPSDPGVYEVKLGNSQERLTIGKTGNLRNRIKGGLVKGYFPHSTGERIRKIEDVSQIVVRWAVTDRPSAVEEELHRIYIQTFGQLPKHTKSTR